MKKRRFFSDLASDSLFEACNKGDINAFQSLTLGFSHLINSRNEKRETPLMIAISHNRIEIVEKLIKSPDIDINAQDEKLKTPLHIACEKGHLDIVGMLLDNEQVQINIKAENGGTPLHYAVYQRRLYIVERLLSHPEIDVNSQDNLGRTPLHNACWISHQKIIEVLLKSPNIDVNAKTIKEATPLHFAASSSFVDCLETLLFQGRNKKNSLQLNAQDQYGQTPLLRVGILSVKSDFEIDLCLEKLLFEPGVDVNISDLENRSILHCFALTESSHIFNQAIERGIKFENINQKYNGLTPLHIALKVGNEAFIRILLEHFSSKIDLNTFSNDIETPLHLAFQQRSRWLTELISQPSVRLDLVDGQGLSYLHYCVIQNLDRETQILHQTWDSPIAKLINLQTYRTKETPLHFVFRLNLVDSFKFLFSLPEVDVNIENCSGNTALHYAILHCNFLSVLDLLQRPKLFKIEKKYFFTALENEKWDFVGYFLNLDSLNICPCKNEKMTEEQVNNCLHPCIKNNYLLAFEKLLKVPSVNINFLIKESKMRPLHTAAYYGRSEMIYLLFKANPNISELWFGNQLFLNEIDVRGRTPLMIAVNNRNHECVKALCSHPSTNPNTPNSRFSLSPSPLHTACMSGDTEIVKLLLSSYEIDTDIPKDKKPRPKGIPWIDTIMLSLADRKRNKEKIERSLNRIFPPQNSDEYENESEEDESETSDEWSG